MKPTRISFRLFTILMVISLLLGWKQTIPAVAASNPKNIIVMIGDGMGYNHSLAASYYRNGAAQSQVYAGFPYLFGVTTYSADGEGYDPAEAASDFDYVKSHTTDSAAAATAMAAAVKTYNGAIGVDVGGNPVGNVLEAAETVGKSTGVVSTVPLSHATPAGFVAHNISRDDYEGIANEMILFSKVDVIMGGGNPWFNTNGEPRSTPNSYKYVGGQSTWDALVAGTVASDRDNDGDVEVATLVQEESQFEALMSGPTPEFVVGVPQVYHTLQQERSGDAMADPYDVPFIGNVPTLSVMSLAAINILDNDPDGFVLMVEAGAIDWAASASQPGRTIEEQIDFDQAVEAVVSWVDSNSSWTETLLIVTADHETGYLWGPGSDPTWELLVNNGLGNLPGMEFYSDGHTNSLVGLYVKGVGADWFASKVEGIDPVRGDYVDNTSIARVVFKALSAYKIFLPVLER